MSDVKKVSDALHLADAILGANPENWPTLMAETRRQVAEAIKEVEAWPALTQPQPGAQEEAYEIGTPREFAERLAWMTIDGKPDLGQWENHIRARDAALSRLAAKEGRYIEALTPSAKTEAAYIGEFTCGHCDHYVPWITIKEIMAAIRERAECGERNYPAPEVSMDLDETNVHTDLPGCHIVRAHKPAAPATSEKPEEKR